MQLSERQHLRRANLVQQNLLFPLLCCYLLGNSLDRQGAAALRQAVLEAAVQCYAVEGKYPESLDRLEREYGVQINHARYIVTYDVYASNQLPDVQVLQK